MSSGERVDERYYQVSTPGSLAERLVVRARDHIYRDFLTWANPSPTSSIVDVGVSDVVGEAANVLERTYPHLDRITAVGLGKAPEFQAAFPQVAYRQIEAGQPLPFPDQAFDIATSNAVLEHVGSEEAQLFFVKELARVARKVFISVPHRYFPVEHHTGIPLLHWADATFRAACALTGKVEWVEPANLILITRSRLERLRPGGWKAHIGFTGIQLGPLSSNLFMYLSDPERS